MWGDGWLIAVGEATAVHAWDGTGDREASATKFVDRAAVSRIAGVSNMEALKNAPDKHPESQQCPQQLSPVIIVGFCHLMIFCCLIQCCISYP